jgi:hypothetical protein
MFLDEYEKKHREIVKFVNKEKPTITDKVCNMP